MDRTPTRPITDMIVSMTDQDRIVSLIERLKYSLKSQNPPSLTYGRRTGSRAPTDNTIRLGSTCNRVVNGKMMPAAVSPATVADPRQTRIMAAMSQPSTRGGTGQPCNISAISPLTPLAEKTLFQRPPPLL